VTRSVVTRRREPAPQALAARIAALTASAPAAPRLSVRRRVRRSCRFVGHVARQPCDGDGASWVFWASRSRRAYVAAHACGSGDVAHILFGFRSRRNRRQRRRRLLRPAYRQALASQPHNGQRNPIVDPRPEGFPLVGGRVTIVDRVPTPTLVYRHTEHVVAVTSSDDARAARGGTGGHRNDRRLTTSSLVRCELNYVAVSDMDEKALGEFVEVFRRAGTRDRTSPA